MIHFNHAVRKACQLVWLHSFKCYSSSFHRLRLHCYTNEYVFCKIKNHISALL